MRMRAFPGRRQDVYELYERAGMWFLATQLGRKAARDWCDRKGVVIRAATGEGIGSGGGFLAPIELENAILDIRDAYGAIRRRACVWPMGSDTSVFPRRLGTGSTTVAFLNENTAAAATTPIMDGVQLTAKKVGALITLSSELNEDSLFDLVDYFANEAAWALAAKEDDCAFNGDGTSTYGGIRGIVQTALDGNHGIAKVQAASGHDLFSQLTAADMASLTGAVRGSAIERAAWYISNIGFAEALQNEATGGYLETEVVDGVVTRYFNGFPVIISQKLANVSTSLSGKGMMVFGDMYGGLVLGSRRGLTIARSDHRYLDTDQIAIMVTARFDIVPHDMGDNVNQGSLAVLVGP